MHYLRTEIFSTRHILAKTVNLGMRTVTGIVEQAPSLLQDKLAAALSQLPVFRQMLITEPLEQVVELMEVGKVNASPNLFAREKITNNGKS